MVASLQTDVLDKLLYADDMSTISQQKKMQGAMDQDAQACDNSDLK